MLLGTKTVLGFFPRRSLWSVIPPTLLAALFTCSAEVCNTVACEKRWREDKEERNCDVLSGAVCLKFTRVLWLATQDSTENANTERRWCHTHEITANVSYPDFQFKYIRLHKRHTWVQQCINQSLNSPSCQSGYCIFNHPFHLYIKKTKEFLCISRKKKRSPSELLMEASGTQRAEEISCSIFCRNSKSPDRDRHIARPSVPSCHYEIFCLCAAPVASLSSWQQPGIGCTGARCMLGDYMHQRLDSTQLSVLDDRRQAQVSQTQRFSEQHQMERRWSADTSAICKNRCKGIFLHVPNLINQPSTAA